MQICSTGQLKTAEMFLLTTSSVKHLGEVTPIDMQEQQRANRMNRLGSK